MDEKLSKLKKKMEEINDLKKHQEWGPEFTLWKNTVDSLVKEIFGYEGFKLFESQGTITFSYIDDGFNRRAYSKELDNRKKIIDGLMANLKENVKEKKSSNTGAKNILKEIWNKEQAIKENLLTTEECKDLQDGLIEHLEKTLTSDSIPGLRFRKIRAEKKHETWWSTTNGYPHENGWTKIEPYLEILAQHEAEKTIKKRIETEGLFVESRSQGNDEHLLVGVRDGTGEKAHIVIDGVTGEIRVEKNRQEPTDLVNRIEAVLTLPSGKKIKSTREALEETE
jgi:hypothetical protein